MAEDARRDSKCCATATDVPAALEFAGTRGSWFVLAIVLFNWRVATALSLGIRVIEAITRTGVIVAQRGQVDCVQHHAKQAALHVKQQVTRPEDCPRRRLVG